MPTYDYRCHKCKKMFELLQSMTAKPLKKCPTCGGRVERLIGAGAGLIFKGSGFYITDYKKKPAPSSDSKPKDTPKETPKETPAAKSDKGPSKPAKSSDG